MRVTSQTMLIKGPGAKLRDFLSDSDSPRSKYYVAVFLLLIMSRSYGVVWNSRAECWRWLSQTLKFWRFARSQRFNVFARCHLAPSTAHTDSTVQEVGFWWGRAGVGSWNFESCKIVFLYRGISYSLLITFTVAGLCIVWLQYISSQSNKRTDDSIMPIPDNEHFYSTLSQTIVRKIGGHKVI